MKTFSANLLKRARFEQLEDRLVLSAAPTIANLPDSITIYQGESYHYAADDLAQIAIADTSTATVASLPSGRLVSIDFSATNSENVTRSLGTIVLQLFENESPQSTGRFLELVEAGYYDATGSTLGTGNTFHRIVDGFVVQGGSSDGYGYSGSSLTNLAFEYSSLLSHSSQGVVAFANSGFATGTSNAQFYITDAATLYLDQGYNIFGFVVSGYDTLEAISSIKTKTTTTPYGTTVSNYPVDKITMSNITVTSTAAQNVLRLAATDDSPVGTSTLALSVTDAEGVTSSKTVTVNVLPRKELDFPVETSEYMSLDVASGESISINLPEYYKATSLVQYTVTGYDSFPYGADEPEWKLDGLTWTLNNRALTIKADASVAQRCVLKISVAAYNNSTQGYTDTADYYLNVFVTPEAPIATAMVDNEEISEETPTSGNFQIVVDDVNQWTTLYMTATLGDVTSESLILRKDGSDTKDEAFMIESTALATGLYRTTITVTQAGLKDLLSLTDEGLSGIWAFSLWQEVPLSNVSEYDNLVSQPDRLLVKVDSEELQIDRDTPTAFVLGTGENDLKFGQEFSLNLVTNKSNSEAYAVQFAFKEGTVVPEGMTLVRDTSDEQGEKWLLEWIPDRSLHANNRYNNITILATDIRGETDEITLSFDLTIAGMPDFLVRYETSTGDDITGTTLQINEGAQGKFYVCVPDVIDETLAATDYSFRIVVTNTTTGEILQKGTPTDLAASGISEWTFEPTDAESPYTFRCDVYLTRKSDSEDSIRSFQVTVPELNVAPTITFEPEDHYDVAVETAYSWKITFTDDLPTQELVWTLSGTVPAGMTISQTVQTEADGTRYVLLSWTPAKDEAEQSFNVTITVTDPDQESDSIEMNFTTGVAPVDPDPDPDPDDDLLVDEPAENPSITNWQDYRAVWNSLVNQRLSALAHSMTKFLTAYSNAATVHRETLATLQNNYAQGTIDSDELATQVASASQARHTAQKNSISNLAIRAEKINVNTLKRVSELNTAADQIGIPTSDGNSILTSRPLTLSMSQMKSVWQMGFSFNNRFTTQLLLAPKAVDSVLVGDLSDLI